MGVCGTQHKTAWMKLQRIVETREGNQD